MLKQKQTIWLILASLCAAGIFFFDLYSITYRDIQSQEFRTVTTTLFDGSMMQIIGISLLVIIPLIAVSIFKKYIIQLILALITILCNCLFMFITDFTIYINRLIIKVPIVEYNYKLGFYLPALSSFILLVAIITIIIERKKSKRLYRLR